MIIVTGAAGFIGSNLVHELNLAGETEILAVDDLTPREYETGPKFLNLNGAAFNDYMDMHAFRTALENGKAAKWKIRAILHQGACSNTLVDDGRYMMENNHEYSKAVLHFALEQKVPLVYASTAAVYGLSEEFAESPENEKPLNIYGFSKLTFDNYVRHLMPKINSTVVGLRYFNVYGPREQHKGRMASVIHHFTDQLKKTGVIRMFEGSGGYGNGEQRRDFVYVRDLAKLNIHFAGLNRDKTLQNSTKSRKNATKNDKNAPIKAIVNAGTGQSSTFNQVAKALMLVHGAGKIEYIPFPNDLKSRYQHFTEADLTGLRNTGYSIEFTGLEQGIKETFATMATL